MFDFGALDLIKQFLRQIVDHYVGTVHLKMENQILKADFRLPLLGSLVQTTDLNIILVVKLTVFVD